MVRLISKLPLLYILFLAYTAYENYEVHLKRMDNLRNEIPRINKNIEKFEKERSQVDQYLKGISEAKEKIELVAKEVENLQRKLPNDINETANLSTIKGVADNLNIKEIFLSPKGSEDKGFYLTRQYEFKGKGTFLQILILFEKIAENERLLNIRSLSLKRLDRPQRGRFEMIECEAIIEAYRYNSNFKEDRGISKIESEFNKPEEVTALKKRKKSRRVKKKVEAQDE